MPRLEPGALAGLVVDLRGDPHATGIEVYEGRVRAVTTRTPSRMPVLQPEVDLDLARPEEILDDEC